MPGAIHSHREAVTAWALEIFAAVASITSFVVIVFVFYLYDGRVPPNWPFDISLNSFASVFAKILDLHLALIGGSVISQQAFLWFSRPRKLFHMKVFYLAARGPRGAFSLIRIQKARGMASLAAFVSFCLPIVGTCIQQAINYPDRLVEANPAWISRSTGYLSESDPLTLRLRVDNGMLAAIKGGWLSDDTELPEIRRFCGTGLCVWSNYTTLDVCSKYHDASDTIAITCDDNSTPNCSSSLPSGLMLSGPNVLLNSTAYFNTTLFPQYPEYFAVFQAIAMIESDQGYRNVVASEGVLYPCLKTYDATFVNGTLYETLKSTWHNTSLGLTVSDPVWYLNPFGVAGGPYTVNSNLFLSIQNYFWIEFFKGAGIIGSTGPDFGDNDALQILYSAMSNKTVEKHLTRLEQSMGTQIRNRNFSSTDGSYNEANAVTGQALKSEIYTHIIWYWLVAPGILTLFSIITLIFTIYKNYRGAIGVYKSNILALINWAPTDHTRQQVKLYEGQSDLQDADQACFVTQNRRAIYRRPVDQTHRSRTEEYTKTNPITKSRGTVFWKRDKGDSGSSFWV